MTHETIGKTESSQTTISIQKRMKGQYCKQQVARPSNWMTRLKLGVELVQLLR